MIHSICIYCGSADRVNPEYISAATQLGQSLARSGLHLVYGAGKTGLMGAVADGVLAEGGQVTGVVPVHLNFSHLIHAGLTDLEVVADMHQRKARMSELADAFIALPGGYGTFEELFETLTWAQLGLHNKPIGLLNTRGYFNPLVELIQHALDEGFIYSEHRHLFISANEPDSLLAGLGRFQPPANIERWISRDDAGG